MSGMTRTSGPWIVHNGDDYTVILGPGDTTDRPLAEVYSGKKLDACTMAAALELLDLAKLFAKSIEYEIRRDRDKEGRTLKTITLNQVLTIIAKAEGAVL